LDYFSGVGSHPSYGFKETILSAKKNNFIGLHASVHGKKWIKEWKETNKIIGNIVTITLRQYGYDITRNSNIDEWVKFSEYIKIAGFLTFFVPDTESSFKHDSKLDGFILFRDVCWNIRLRTALYEKVILNFFVSGRPASLAQLNKKAKSVAPVKEKYQVLKWEKRSLYKCLLGVQYVFRYLS
jgi:hypothetical protein